MAGNEANAGTVCPEYPAKLLQGLRWAEQGISCIPGPKELTINWERGGTCSQSSVTPVQGEVLS